MSNIISYNSKQRFNVSTDVLIRKRKSFNIARVPFNEPRLPKNKREWSYSLAKNKLGINGIFFCFKFQVWTMAPHNSSQFLYQDCLIADLSIDTQLQLLNISKYVFRPLNLILAFSSFVLNTLVIIAVARTKSLQYPAMFMICSLAVTDAILLLNIMHKIIEVFAYERLTCPNVHPRPVQTATSALCIQATLGNFICNFCNFIWFATKYK